MIMKARHRWLTPFAYLALTFLYLPIAIIIIYSFNAARINAAWAGFTFEWYMSLFQNQHVLQALSNSLLIACGTMLLATPLGTMAALAFHRYRFRLRLLWNNLMYLPLLMPEIIMGISLLVLFNYLGWPLGKLSILIAHVTFCIPFVFLIVMTRLSGMSKELEEAALDLGASPWQTFRFVTLPIIMPSVLASALLTFSLSLDDFMITFFVAGPGATTLPLYIYGMIKRGITPEVNALATLLVLVTLLIVAVAEWVRRKGSNGQQVRPD